ncbi:MAG TPA: hypothetical protein VGE52_14065, partial [Pirellulales bacterium]
MLSPPQSVWRRRLLLAPAAVMIALIARELLPFSRSRRDLQAVLADRGHAWVAIRPDESAPAASVEFSGTRVDAELVEAIAEESVRKGRVADNVGKVVCFGGSLTADGIDSLSRWPALTQLSLENVEPPAAPILHGFERLREVKLQGMTLTQTFAAALASSPGLRTVRLDFVALERGALTALCRGRGLGELHLDEALMAPGELSALSLASNLRVLTLAPRHGSPDNAASLSPLASLP